MIKWASLCQPVCVGRSVFGLTLALNLVSAVHISLAQDLLPELAAPAAQYKTAVETLDKQKLEAIAGAAKSYVSALDSVEKAATAKGELELVATVVKEREAAASGALEPDLPAALPKARLQMSRKSLLASIKRISADFAKRKNKADADYLRVLATLQSKAAANPELAKQLAAEKTALLGNDGAAAEPGKKASKKANAKNVVVNGDFETVTTDGSPEGWRFRECAKVEKEGKNTFMRIECSHLNNDGSVCGHYIGQEFAVPKDAIKVTVSARLRTKNRVISKTPPAFCSFRDVSGNELSVVYASWNEKKGCWMETQGAGPVPKNAEKVKFMLTNGKCAGQFDYDDIEVTFK